MSTGTQTPATTKQSHDETLPAIHGPRLPFHPLVEQRFGIDRASWKALVEAIFPNASAVESVILALSYCRARKLDPFKRVVHIVPIWSKELGRMTDTVWPGIGELRTTAFRTGEYAGRGETIFGPDRTEKVGKIEMTFPDWAQVTVQRMIHGRVVPFSGPRVYWLETYATASRNDHSPNSMWENRPRGQIDKCAEAAALRAAFPEECGGDYIPEEVQHQAASKTVDAVTTKQVQTLGDLTKKLTTEAAADLDDCELPPVKLEPTDEAERDEPEGETEAAQETPPEEPSGDDAFLIKKAEADDRFRDPKKKSDIGKAEEEYRVKCKTEAARLEISAIARVARENWEARTQEAAAK